MKQYFLKINIYSPKNKAHEAIQNFAMQYEKCLIDEPQFFQFGENMKDKIAAVNSEFKRCQDIELQFRKMYDKSYIFSVESNFSFSVYEVKRYELSASGRDPVLDHYGDMKADAE
jgi:hypothetical protein